MNNLQVMNRSGGGAAVDLMMNTFTAPKKSGAGGFDFADAFESKVNDAQPYDSFMTNSNDSFSDQFSFESQNAYEPVRYDEPASRKEEPVAREENVKPREEEARPVKEEKAEREPTEERAKEDTNEGVVSDKDADSEKKADERDSGEGKPEEKAEEDKSEAKGGNSKEEKSSSEGESGVEEKKAEKADLGDIEFKTETTEEKVDLKEVDLKEADLKEVENAEVDLKAEENTTENVEADSSVIKRSDTQEAVVATQKVVADQGVAAQKQVEEEVEVVEESISATTKPGEQAKLEAVQIKQFDQNKNNDQAGAKKFALKRDMVDQLEKETGIKIDKMSMEKVKAAPDEMAQKTSKDLLKSLDTNRGRFDMQNAKEVRTGEADIKDTILNEKPELKLNKLDIAKNLIKNNTTQTRTESQTPTNNEPSNSFANAIKDQSPMERAGKTMQQTQAGNSPNLRNMNNVQEIMNSLKTMLRGSDFQANAKLNLDFQTQAFGQMRMGVMHKDDGIEVSIEVGSDSSKQELLKQRDELSEQLKNLGYKNVNVDISYGDHQQQQDAKHQQMSGNEDIRNVKLAGDDSADLSELLNMV